MTARRLAVVALVCALVLAPFAYLPGPGDDHVVEVSEIDDLRAKLLEQRQPPPTEGREVDVVLRLKGTEMGAVARSSGFEVDRTYTREGERIVEGTVSQDRVRELSTDPRISSIQVAGDGSVAAVDVAPGIALVGADRLHEAGVTGENVTVGVVDTDFKVSHRALAGSDATYRRFDADAGDWQHGTAVASVVAATAPGADLRLAAVGSTTSAEEYREAVDWLLEGGADVVVDSGSYYAQPGDGNGSLARIAADVSGSVVFVTSAGNHAERYWTGNYSDGDGDWVEFADGRDGNYLNDGEPFSGDVDLSVRWDDWPATGNDFDLYLWRERAGRDVLVGRTSGGDDQPFEHLSKRVPHGTYYVSIRATDVEEDRRLELFANHALTERSVGGTTAPASADGVVAVGAVDNGTLRPYSARANVDVVAPDSVALPGATLDSGTSFAAPYAAGVAALVAAANPEMNATEVRQRLYANATALGDGEAEGVGHGLVSAAGLLATSDASSADATVRSVGVGTVEAERDESADDRSVDERDDESGGDAADARATERPGSVGVAATARLGA